MLIKKIGIIMLLFSFSVLCLNCKRNVVVAEYMDQGQKKYITHKDLEYFAAKQNVKLPESSETLKEIAREYALFILLSKKAVNDKLHESKEYTFLSNYLENILVKSNYLKNILNYYQNIKAISFYNIDKIEMKFVSTEQLKSDKKTDVTKIYKSEMIKMKKLALECYSALYDKKLNYNEARLSYATEDKNKQPIDDIINYKSLVEVDNAAMWSVYRLDKRKNLKQYLVNERSGIYQKPSISSKKILNIVNGSIVVEMKNAPLVNNEWLYIEYHPGMFGYISKKHVKDIGIQKEFSYPVEIPYGYAIFRIKEQRNYNKKAFFSDFKKTIQYKSNKVKEPFLNYRWNEITTKLAKNYVLSLNKKYLETLSPFLPRDWKKINILLQSQTIKVTNEDMINYIKTMEILKLGISPDVYEVHKKLFLEYTELLALVTASKNEKITFNQKKDDSIDFYKKYNLAKYYKFRNWTKNVAISDAEVISEHQKRTKKYIEKNKNVKLNLPVFDTDAKNKFKSALLNEKIKLQITIQEIKFLDANSFKLYENNLK